MPLAIKVAEAEDVTGDHMGNHAVCPRCGSGSVQVLDTRAETYGRIRRYCCGAKVSRGTKGCGMRWTTRELSDHDFKLLEAARRFIADIFKATSSEIMEKLK